MKRFQEYNPLNAMLTYLLFDLIGIGSSQQFPQNWSEMKTFQVIAILLESRITCIFNTPHWHEPFSMAIYSRYYSVAFSLLYSWSYFGVNKWIHNKICTKWKMARIRWYDTKFNLNHFETLPDDDEMSIQISLWFYKVLLVREKVNFPFFLYLIS